MGRLRRLLLAILIIVALPLPASAHSWSELNDFLDGWWNRHQIAFRHDTGVTPFTGNYRLPAIYAEMEDMLARHPGWDGDYLTKPAPRVHIDSVYRGMGTNVEPWRPLVVAYFPADQVERAMCVMKGESGGNPNALSYKGARGLFQIMPGWAGDFGISVASLYDPETNVKYAARILGIQGWRAWSVYKRGLCP